MNKFGPYRDQPEPNLSRVQEEVLLRLFTTGIIGKVRASTLKCLFDEGCVMEDANRTLVVTPECKEYCQQLLENFSECSKNK